MYLYPTYRQPSKPLPGIVMNIGAVLVCLIGVPLLIIARVLGRV